MLSPLPTADRSLRAPGRPRTGYLPSLDGWRALAILGVVMTHDGPWTLGRWSNVVFKSYGGWGVYLFFAISGVLVCTRILEDEAILGHFRIRDFYVRRLFRIQPAAIAYLAALAALDLFGVTHERLSALLGGLFLYQNYLFNAADHTGSWFLTGHFWTLSVEEHFYLLLSLLLFCTRRFRASIFAAVLLLNLLWLRLAIHWSVYSPLTSTRRTEWLLPYLMGPALLAILLRRKAVRDFAIRYLHPWVAFLGTALVKLAWCLIDPIPVGSRHHLMAWIVDTQSILLTSFSFWVIATMLHPRSWTTRFLERKPLRFLGRISYSVYLWHVLFFAADAPLAGVHTPWLLFLTHRPWKYVATVVLSLISYYCIEKPMVRLGHRLAPPATPGHKDLQTLQGSRQAIPPDAANSQVPA